MLQPNGLLIRIVLFLFLSTHQLDLFQLLVLFVAAASIFERFGSIFGEHVSVALAHAMSDEEAAEANNVTIGYKLELSYKGRKKVEIPKNMLVKDSCSHVFLNEPCMNSLKQATNLP